MATDYPNGIDNFVNPTASDTLDSATVPHATQHANANDAIEAIETELGTNPKGTYASVKARFDAATANDTANEVVKRDANQSFSIGAINFDTTSAQTTAVGKLYWDGNGSLALGLLGGNVTVGINEDIVCYVTNAEATTLNVGEVVYLYGAQGDRPTVKRASNTSDATSAKTFGFVAESIAANQAGFVTIRGTVRKVNTSAFNPGDSLYLGSTAGSFTNVKPSAPNHLVYLGVVERSNSGNGQIQVVVQNGYELEELHNVSIVSATNGQTLFYNSSTGLWENKSISATAPITYDASTRTIAANAASTSASGVVQLSDSTSTTSSVLASTPTATKAAYDLANTANTTANAAIPATQKGAANGVATLGADSKVPQSQLPAVAITNTYVVNSQSAMLALTAEEGDVAIRTDVSKSYILTAVPASTLGNWQELLSPPDAVTSVDGRTGVVTLTDKYAQLATANTFSGSQTATSFVVTGSTIPANGIYLPSANTLGLATNSAVRMQINAVGEIGIGAAAATARSLLLSKAITGATTAIALRNNGQIQSDVTALGIIYSSIPSTQATSFTLTELDHYRAEEGSIGAGSAITNQVGFYANNLTSATNNFGFYSNIASGSNRWNIYMVGTAANYFAGQTTVGSTSLTLGSSSVAQQFGIVSAAATNIVAVIRGAASQTGNLTEWQNSSGTVLARINSSGGLAAAQVFTRYYSNSANTGAYFDTENISGTWSLIQRTTTAVNLIAQAAASQSADLQQWQNSSGTILNAIGADGNIRSETQLIQYGAEGSVLQNVPTRVHPAETLLKQSVWWIDAAHSASSGQTIKNLGWGGSALDCTLGLSTSADTNDPQYLPWDGVNYVYLPGAAGNYLSVPDANNLDITGDIDLRAYVAVDALGEFQMLTKYETSGNFSWLFETNTTGNIRLRWSADGTNLITPAASTFTFTVGVPKWVRATLDVNNGAGGYTLKYYTSDDGITWTQSGSDIVGASTTSIYAGTSKIEIGSRSNGAVAANSGRVFRSQLCNGIDGVPVLDVDTSVISSGSATSFTALTGQTVTINRATSGRKTTCVVNPVWLFGTDDYMEVNNRWLEHTGTNYLYLPGVASNYASAPDSAALDITGDIDLRVKVALDDWTPSTPQRFISKRRNSALSNSYDFYLETTGQLALYWSPDGGATSIYPSSTVNPTVTDGSTLWVRATLDVDNGAGAYEVKFYTSTDGSNWTQLGATITGASTTSIYNSNAQLEIGSWNLGANGFSRGKFFRAQVYNGIGGTLAFDANFETSITTNLPTTFTESSANAATVTINYSGTSYRSCGVIASTYVYPGNPNTFKLSTTSLLDFGATDSFTVLAIVRRWNTQSYQNLITKKLSDASTAAGYTIYTDASNKAGFIINDGSANVDLTTGSSYVSGSLTSIVGVRSVSADTISLITGNTISKTDTSTSSLSTIETLKFGKGAATAGNADSELVALAVFRRDLTAAEIATLSNYYAGRYGA